jgi:hypothetical protein
VDERRPTCLYLIGYPGAGKYTVSQELIRLTERDMHFVLVDNHYTNNVIFSLLATDGKTSLGAQVWDKVHQVSKAVLETIESLSPREWSFVFTNVLVDNADDAALYERISAVAAARESHFVPVTLTCNTDELVRRVVRPDRSQRLKWTDPDSLQALVANTKLLPVRHRNHLELDVTTLGATEAAQAILAHLDSVTARAI